MADKEAKDKAYADGVKDGKSDNSLGDIVQGLGLGSCSMDKDLRAVYDKGHDFGREHRYDGSQGGSAKTSDQKSSSENSSARDRGDGGRDYYSSGGTSSYSGGYTATHSGSSVGSIVTWIFLAIVVVLFGSCASAVFLHYNPLSEAYYSILREQERALMAEGSRDHMGVYSLDMETMKVLRLSAGSHPSVAPNGEQITFVRKRWSKEKTIFSDTIGGNMNESFNSNKSYWFENTDFLVTVVGDNVIFKGTSKKYSQKIPLGIEGVDKIVDFACSPKHFIAVVGKTKLEEVLYVKGIKWRKQPLLKCYTGKNIQIISWFPNNTKLAIYDNGQPYILYFDWLNIGGPLNETLKLRQVQSLPLSYQNIQWSPDGSKFTFDCKLEENDCIFLYEYAEKRAHFLTLGRLPVWSSDGQRILFKRHDDLYCLNADGTTSMLANNVADGYCWLPNGKKIFFSKKDEKKS